MNKQRMPFIKLKPCSVKRLLNNGDYFVSWNEYYQLSNSGMLYYQGTYEHNLSEFEEFKQCKEFKGVRLINTKGSDCILYDKPKIYIIKRYVNAINAITIPTNDERLEKMEELNYVYRWSDEDINYVLLVTDVGVLRYHVDSESNVLKFDEVILNTPSHVTVNQDYLYSNDQIYEIVTVNGGKYDSLNPAGQLSLTEHQQLIQYDEYEGFSLISDTHTQQTLYHLLGDLILDGTYTIGDELMCATSNDIYIVIPYMALRLLLYTIDNKQIQTENIIFIYDKSFEGMPTTYDFVTSNGDIIQYDGDDDVLFRIGCIIYKDYGFIF